MSSQPAIVAPTGFDTTTTTSPVSRSRIAIVAYALALGSAAVAAVLLWHPWPPRNDFSYADMAVVRDATWTGILIDAVGYAVVAVALSIAVCLLAPARGARWANAGAVLAVLGGILVAAGELAYAALGWYATATAAIPTDAGSALMNYAKNHSAHVFGPQIAGFLTLNLGVLVLAAALWRARSVPRWLPIAIAVLTIGQFVLPTNRILDIEQATLMVAFIAVAWYFRRATAGRTR